MQVRGKRLRNLWRLAVYLPLAIISVVLLAGQYHRSLPDNGFDLEGALVPVDEIHHGGPPRDGIPAIDSPKFLTAGKAGFLGDADPVLGVFRNGVAKAYPVKILNYHEIVNDHFADEPVVVTFCPLCGTGLAFSAWIGGEAARFGVSGLLYNSDVLFYDRATESLWSQLLGQAISGPLKGQRLKALPLSHTRWEDWRTRYPATLVMSDDTGHRRDYSRNPYAEFAGGDYLSFPVSHRSRRYHAKELVIGVEVDGHFKAYPFAELSQGAARVRDRLGGEDLEILFNAEHRTGRVLDAGGRELPSVIGYWFAWYAFHPDTEVYQAGGGDEP